MKGKRVNSMGRGWRIFLALGLTLGVALAGVAVGIAQDLVGWDGQWGRAPTGWSPHEFSLLFASGLATAISAGILIGSIVAGGGRCRSYGLSILGIILGLMGLTGVFNDPHFGVFVTPVALTVVALGLMIMAMARHTEQSAAGPSGPTSREPLGSDIVVDCLVVAVVSLQFTQVWHLYLEGIVCG